MNAILIVVHGAENANDSILRFGLEVESATGISTMVGFKRYGEPKLRKALEKLVVQGANIVAVIPLFMSDSKYSRAIPQNLGLEPSQTRGTVRTTEGKIDIRISEPIGIDPGMDDVIRAAVKKTGIPPETGGVVLLAHGGNGMKASGEKALKNDGYMVKYVSSHCTRDLHEAIAELESEGRTKIAVVQARVTPAAIPLLSEHPGVIVTGPVGSSEEVVKLVAEIAIRLFQEEC